MRLYPASTTARTRTLAGDLAVLALLVLFAWAGVKVHDGILDLTTVGREVQDSGRAIAATTRDTAGAIDGAFADAGRAVGAVPLVGGQLAGALREAPKEATNELRAAGDEQGAKIVRLGVEQVRRTETAANWAGWLVFLLPSVVLLMRVLPGRVRKVTAGRTAERTLSGAPEHVLAARAAFTLDYDTLRRYTEDPFGDLAAGRHDALVRALREDAGLPHTEERPGAVRSDLRTPLR